MVLMGPPSWRTGATGRLSASVGCREGWQIVRPEPPLHRLALEAVLRRAVGRAGDLDALHEPDFLQDAQGYERRLRV
ncbi:conserved hypothetical protein (plasmid) [Methylobacterium nodulans ORS 2060]|uniref:Uncharacterized protein n=2 Tax=Methylobacterium nodulans TaxID=114616 RepID=B8IXT5_METNO|nr:conserved hypothetical protein [Methylobacterium nodulans ORS 2060]